MLISRLKIKECPTCKTHFTSYLSEKKIFCNLECRNKNYKTRLGIKSQQWKGDKAGYSAIHKYIQKYYGKPTTCQDCKTTGLFGNKIQWANLDGNYSRDIKTWKRLCAKCHQKLDGTCISKQIRKPKHL